jgi:small-conductance mechanosensitive channel
MPSSFCAQILNDDDAAPIILGNNIFMLRNLVTAIFALTLLAFNALAQPAGEPAVAAPPTATAATAEPLVIFNRQVVTFRASLLGISARDRVKRARARIQEQLTALGSHTVTLNSEDNIVQVQIDGATSFVVQAADLDPGREDTLEQTAQRAAESLTQAIRESLESRSLETLIRELAQAVAATALYAALVWLAARGHRALASRLIAIAEKHSTKLHVGGLALWQRDRMANAVRLVVVLVYRVLVLMLTVEWLSYVLRSFPFTRAWGESLNGYLVNLILPLATKAIATIPELLTAALIFYLAYLITKGLDRLLANVQSGKVQLHWLDADSAIPTQRIARVVVWLFALAAAYPYLPGSDTEAFKGLSVLVGLMLSMGASSLVGQAASGLILTYGRAFRKGEYVHLADHEGTVTEMGLFTTRIRTGLGEELTISNASILASTTKNYSRAVKGAGFVLDTTVTIGYDTPWRQVHALLIDAAKRTPGILHDPAPRVFQTSLSDWYPVYRLVCQAIPEGPAPRAMLLSNLLANIQDIFSEYGVQIMSPQYITDPANPKLVPVEKWYAAPATRADPVL